MKIRVTTIINALVVFIALSLSDFFYIGFSFNKMYLILLSVFVVALCTIYYRSEFKTVLQDQFVVRYIGVVLFSIFVLLLYTKLSFRAQSIQISVATSYPYFMVLIAIPLLCWFLRDGKENSIFDVLNVFCVIWYAMVLAQSVAYPKIIIPAYFGDAKNLMSGVFYRSNRLRMGLQMFGNLMIVYNFYKVYVPGARDKHRLWNVALLMMGLIELVIIQQTRMYVSVIAVCLMMIILTEGKGKKGLLKKTAIVFLLVVAVSQTTFVSNLIDSVFSLNSELRASTNARIYSWTYYSDYFFRHPIGGFGFANAALFNTVVHGPLGYAYIDDVGIVGQMARLGVFIIPIYLAIIIRFFSVLKEIKRYGSQNDFVLYCSLFTYILSTSITLIMLDPQRIFLYPLSIALFEFKHIEIRRIKAAEATT